MWDGGNSVWGHRRPKKSDKGKARLRGEAPDPPKPSDEQRLQEHRARISQILGKAKLNGRQKADLSEFLDDVAKRDVLAVTAWRELGYEASLTGILLAIEVGDPEIMRVGGWVEEAYVQGAIEADTPRKKAALREQMAEDSRTQRVNRIPGFRVPEEQARLH